MDPLTKQLPSLGMASPTSLFIQAYLTTLLLTSQHSLSLLTKDLHGLQSGITPGGLGGTIWGPRD